MGRPPTLASRAECTSKARMATPLCVVHVRRSLTTSSGVTRFALVPPTSTFNSRSSRQIAQPSCNCLGLRQGWLGIALHNEIAKDPDLTRRNAWLGSQATTAALCIQHSRLGSTRRLSSLFPMGRARRLHQTSNVVACLNSSPLVCAARHAPPNAVANRCLPACLHTHTHHTSTGLACLSSSSRWRICRF